MMVANTPRKLVIDSDDAAYKIISEILSNNLDNNFTVCFENWPNLNLYLKGGPFESSLTTGVMKQVIDLQKIINRTYAYITSGELDATHLSQKERDSLELVVHVAEGSSDLKVRLEEVFTKILRVAADKMEAKHIVTTMLGLGLMYFGESSFNSYLDMRKDIRLAELQSTQKLAELDQLKFASEQDKNNQTLLIEALDSVNKDRTAQLSVMSDELMNTVLKAASMAKESKIQGIQLSSSVAKELTSNKRNISEDVRLDGYYFIDRVDTTDPDGFKLKIRSDGDGLVIDAKVQDGTVNKYTRVALSNAEWSKDKVRLMINAKKVKGEIKSAVVIDIDPERLISKM
tara:strand:+ start:32071 stop:33102 length:1032 start_codon:yes stop_codon:yes gene_type:complete